MYCGQCGKKVMENMLFCPFCGSPIVIPDQDAPPQAAKEAEDRRPQPEEQGADMPAAEQVGPVSLYGTEAVPTPGEAAQEEQDPIAQEQYGDTFEPLRFSFDELFAMEDEQAGDADAVQGGEDVQTEPAPEQIVDIPETPVQPQPAKEPVRRQAGVPRPENQRRRTANTYIPVKLADMDDIFMDGDGDEYDPDEDMDDYDLDDYDLDDALDEDFDDEDYDFEEREEGGFMRRHVRGMVGLILFLLLAAICVFWASTDKGQLTLARFNLAWRAEPYAELGYEAYLADSDLMAARYYERALSRSSQNYEYAHSAMVAYYEADDIEAAAGMLRKCIAMQPDNPEPYREMLILYPDAESRPWEISELIRTGYQRTGDEALKGQ